MKMSISHIEPVSFWNLRRNCFCKDIWTELKSGLWTDYDISAGIENDVLTPDNIHLQAPVFPAFQQITPGTRWNCLQNKLVLDLYSPRYKECTLNQFIDTAAEFIENLNAKRIGIHLSGGLDSSIIICILKELGIPFVPIGLQSDTFEFRTERYIQNLLIDYGIEGELISLQDYPFYSDLSEIPPHQIPMASIKSNKSTRALAEAFRQHGCDVVLSGQGGDTLFVNEISGLSNVYYNIGYEFENPYDQEMYYGPADIRLISFFSSTAIIDELSTAALGRREDPQKLWARKWFSNILPDALSKYHYCADFFAFSLGCLENAKNEIKVLFEEAYDRSHNRLFSTKNTRNFLSQDIFSFEHKEYIRFCSLISAAVWYHSLFTIL